MKRDVKISFSHLSFLSISVCFLCHTLQFSFGVRIQVIVQFVKDARLFLNERIGRVKLRQLTGIEHHDAVVVDDCIQAYK